MGQPAKNRHLTTNAPSAQVSLPDQKCEFAFFNISTLYPQLLGLKKEHIQTFSGSARADQCVTHNTLAGGATVVPRLCNDCATICHDSAP
jgi:hypothetical protein